MRKYAGALSGKAEVWTLGIIQSAGLIDNATVARKISHSVCQCLSICSSLLFYVYICYNKFMYNFKVLVDWEIIGSDAFMGNCEKHVKIRIT